LHPAYERASDATMSTPTRRRVATDAQLSDWLQDYQAGSIDAFDALYGALESELRSFFRGHARDLHRVDDLLQETFLQIHRARASYLVGRPVRPWVYAIAKRVFLMHLRTVRRREMPEAARLADLPDAGTSAPAHATIMRVEIADAVARVTDDRRQAFLLHHWWGFSFRQIAAKLGIQPSAAKLRSSRGAGQLRQLLRHGDGSRE
jgi:RNA polymerase sigma-70 factor (ECF subfamily)